MTVVEAVRIFGTLPAFEPFLAKNQNHHYTAIIMNSLSRTDRTRREEERRIASARHAYAVAPVLWTGEGRRRFFWARGSAQPIEKSRFGKGFPRKIELFSLIVFGRALPGLAKFGFRLD
jgi:hypothetical protein